MMTLTAADLRPVADDAPVEGPRAERPRRRAFTAQYKARVLAEYEAAEPGEKGVVLRREGLYSSHLVEWRRARDAAALTALGPQRRPGRPSSERAEMERLRGRAERAEAELARTQAALEVVGKVHALLEMLSGSADPPAAVHTVIAPAVTELATHVGTQAACRLLGRSRAGHYRGQARARGPAGPLRPPPPRATPANALTEAERQEILRVLSEPRFADKSVGQVWATLLDEGTYLASRSTMHRVLRAAGQAGERRRQAVHPARVRPELLATGPQQVWSWDITKLRGPERGSHDDLYVILDIYSRYVVGWTVAATENSTLAKD